MPDATDRVAEAGELRSPRDSELRSLREDQARLVSENLQYMGVLSRYARAFGLCGTLGLEPLCERIVEGLCLEARAQGGSLWVAADPAGSRLGLAAVRGVLQPHDEPDALRADEIPGLAAGERGAFVGPGPGGADALFVPLRSGGRLLAMARVSDRVDAAEFDDRDRAAAEQFAEVATVALANALRFRELEHRSLRDPRTGAWTPAFFEGVARTEIHKAQRFGRCLSLLEIELAGLPAVRSRLGEAAAAVLVEGFASRLQQALRGSDLCAVEGESRYRLLLPETDALGAAALKRRLRGLVEPEMPAVDGPPTPTLRLAAVTFPRDGGSLEALGAVLARRLDEEGQSLARVLETEARNFAESRQRLLQRGHALPPRLPEQALRFVLGEVRRRSHERALLWLAPGRELEPVAVEELSRLRGARVRAEIVLFSDHAPRGLAGLPASSLAPGRAGTRSPFVVYLGDGPAYVLLRAREAEPAVCFHSSDRVLVEHLAFQLRRDVGAEAAA